MTTDDIAPEAGLDETELGVLAHELRTSVGRLIRVLREHGGRMGLTPSQAEALGFLLRDGATTISALARSIGVRSQSLGATATALEEQGLVTVTADPGDGRQKILTATDRAHDLVMTSRAVREDWLAQQITTTLTPAEQRTLQEAAALLTRLTGA